MSVSGYGGYTRVDDSKDVLAIVGLIWAALIAVLSTVLSVIAIVGAVGILPALLAASIGNVPLVVACITTLRRPVA